MAQIYGELVRAQLQSSATDLTPVATGLVYFNTSTGLKWYTGSAWKVAVDLDSSQTLAGKTLDATCSVNASALPIVTAAKGGLGTDASAFTGVLKASAGTFSAATIVNADVSASAAIAYSKLANLTAGSVLLGNASNVPTATALTGDVTVNSSGVTSISSGVIVNADVNASAAIAGTKISPDFGSQNVQTTGSVTGTNVVNAGYQEFSQIATPSNPSSGKVRVYAKADNKLYKKDSSGNETAVGSGTGSGGVNYLVDWYDATKAVGTVSTVAVGGNVAVSGSFPSVTSAWYADATSGATVTAGSFVIGKTYVISSVGTTDFTLIGAASNTVGVTFTATGVGTGTGQAVSSAAFVSTDNTLRGTTNFLTQLSSASTAGATFVQSPVFNIDGEDLGKALTVQFDVSGNTTDDDWDVVAVRYNSSGVFQELIPIAGNASSMTATPSAKLPIGVKTFNGFFITSSTASDVYAIRWRRRNGSVAIRLDSLTVGPQQVLQGYVGTDWTEFTPSWSGVTVGNGTSTARWRRVGDSMELEGVFLLGSTSSVTGNVTFTIPNSLTIKTQSAISFGMFGVATAYRASNVAARQTGAVNLETSTSVSFANSGSGGSNWNASVPFAWTTSDAIQFKALIPISQWVGGSNTQQAARAVEEYASNSSTSDADDTTSFVYGPNGSTTPGVLTGYRQKRVRFQTPVLPTDILVVEVKSQAAGAKWTAVTGTYNSNSGIGGLQRQGTIGAGIGINDSSTGVSTDVDVTFGRYAYLGAGTYATAGQDWATTQAYWRVKKVSGGAAVGFPVGARNVIGDTTGTTVPAGYVGERIAASISNGNTASTTDVDVTGSSITLTPGVWILLASVSVQSLPGSDVAGKETTGLMRMTDSANTLIAGTCKAIQGIAPAVGREVTGMNAYNAFATVSISSNTTYKLRAKVINYNGATGSLYWYNNGTSLDASFFAIRIA